MILILFLALSLSLDSFATAMSLSMRHPKAVFRTALFIASIFAICQMMMPLIGSFIGDAMLSVIAAFDHWLAFVVLPFVGGKAIYESFQDDDDETARSITWHTVTVLGIATSLDALATGITLPVLEVSRYEAIAVIGIVTFVCSIGGFLVGRVAHTTHSKRVELLGGIVLVAIGVKILLSHIVV